MAGGYLPSALVLGQSLGPILSIVSGVSSI
jgi:hypothetical protein